MAVTWDLTLYATNENDVEKINAYAKDLNEKYGLPLYEEDPDYGGGLQFFDRGFHYVDDDYTDKVEQFEKMVEEVVAHFPEMPLQFRGSGDGPCQQWRKVAKNGVLVDVQLWAMQVHCDKENYEQLQAHIPYITEQGFEVESNDKCSEICWQYYCHFLHDKYLFEEEKSNSIVEQLSKCMPEVTLYCYKSVYADAYLPFETYCIMRNGEGEWEDDELGLNYLVEGNMYNNNDWSIGEIIKDPIGHFLKLLEQARNGKEESADTVSSIVYNAVDINAWLHCFKPEDKQWLTRLDEHSMYAPLCLGVVLAGMYSSWKSWEEPFTDEDTGETVVVTRRETLDTPLFASEEGEAQALLERICKERGGNSKKIVYLIRNFTPLDYTRIIREEYEALLENCRKREPFYDLETIHQWGGYGWMCEELGDLYFYGEERFGYFIDIEKAKFFYAEAQKAKDYHKDESLLVNGNPMDMYDEA